MDRKSARVFLLAPARFRLASRYLWFVLSKAPAKSMYVTTHCFLFRMKWSLFFYIEHGETARYRGILDRPESHLVTLKETILFRLLGVATGRYLKLYRSDSISQLVYKLMCLGHCCCLFVSISWQNMSGQDWEGQGHTHGARLDLEMWRACHPNIITRKLL